jgi:hypothetical protein
MIYRIRLEVYDNSNTLIIENKLQPDLTNPTVGDIKSLLNPGTYTDIKSEFFMDGDLSDLDNNDFIKNHFIKYKIYLN